MYQMAHITCPIFRPAIEVGRLLWVKCERPCEEELYKVTSPAQGGQWQREDSKTKAQWYETNLFYQGVRLRIACSDVELLPCFAEQVEEWQVEQENAEVIQERTRGLLTIQAAYYILGEERA